jgi:hypothetical protein
MSFVPEHQRRLIIEVLLKKISKDDFYREYPVRAEEAGRLSVEMLRRALQEKDKRGVEYGLYLLSLFGLLPEHQGQFMELAAADWHEMHEMVVDGLSELNAPASAPAFYHAALTQYPYRDYDDYDTLGVKAIWALGRLQTQEGVERLADLATSGRPILEKNAREQLARIVARSESEALREAARERLEALARPET